MKDRIVGKRKEGKQGLRCSWLHMGFQKHIKKRKGKVKPEQRKRDKKKQRKAKEQNTKENDRKRTNPSESAAFHGPYGDRNRVRSLTRDGKSTCTSLSQA